ncbi:MAG: sensory histidine kinase AtoS [Methanocella sp. PtaU1.Bin125]|nr:MAG: sensory histidine kinase AtoS [Methanocella sp. PtaU1.Bin125]
MRSDQDEWLPLREKIIGLGDSSFRKSYYPELQRKIADLEQFRAILDQSDDGIFMVDTGTGRIIDVSGSAWSQLGYSRNAMIGMGFADLVDESARGAFDSLFGGRVQHVDIGTTLRGRNGVQIPCEISVSIALLDGKAIAVAIARDVAVRKQIGDEVKRSEDTYQAIFNSVNDGIVILDIGTGRAVDVNESACRILGISHDVAASMDFLGEIAVNLKVSREDFLKELQAIASGGSRLLEGQMKGSDGRQFWIEVSLKYGRIRGNDRIIAVVRDITERKLAEEQIRASLKEKEVMLKEIHHRVKNNLQVISSLLSIQSRYLSDPHDVKLFQESQDRVKSMALVHEKLYQSSDLASVDFSSYIERLVTNLFRSYSGSGGNVNLHLDIRDVFLNVDTAVPCGLIVNELVTNALKYAFPAGRDGTVSVLMRAEGDRYVLEVGDDGVGMAPGFDIEKSESLGLQLVAMLVGQIDGTIKTDTSKGTRYVITFGRPSNSAE